MDEIAEFASWMAPPGEPAESAPFGDSGRPLLDGQLIRGNVSDDL